MNTTPPIPSAKWQAALDLIADLDETIPCSDPNDCTMPATRVLGIQHAKGKPCGCVYSFPMCIRHRNQQREYSKTRIGTRCPDCQELRATLADIIAYDRPL